MTSIINSNSKKDLFLLASYFRRLNGNIILHMSSASSVLSQSKTETPPTKTEIMRFPVQPLKETLQKYIESVKPFVNEEELTNTKKIVDNFSEPNNIGTVLQSLLEFRAKNIENWLSDWWLDTAYLEYRDPVVVYSSPGLVWPAKNFQSEHERICYAATIIHSALLFNILLEKKKLPQDMLGSFPLCMNQYYKIFGTCRIPDLPKDKLLFQDPKNPSTNILVIYNNQFFSINAFKNDTRNPLSINTFYTMLLDIVENNCSEDVEYPVGVLTTENRDNWAEAYKELKRNDINKDILENYIEKALFVVCLDKPLPNNNSSYDTKCSKLLLHGCGSKYNAGNRWYDKTIQFIFGCGSDGVGVAYEHSPAEGGPIGVLTDYVLLKEGKISNSQYKFEKVEDYPLPQKLEFCLNDNIKEAITKAKVAVNKISSTLNVNSFSFFKFGKNEIKKLKVSPDSFIQVAIQYAFHELHKHPGAQYESGSLRRFVNGRTDTIRTCSEDVLKFCQKMSEANASKDEKKEALLKALSSHKKYAKEVVEGKGIDRHLLGLKILAKINGVENLNLFNDVAYQRSTYFQLSTSNVPVKCNGFMVYGPLVKDGYACCYNPRDNNINFGMTAWFNSDKTNLNEFRKNLCEALMNMKCCLENDETVKSKL
ncbi:carnitine palmitoyltransferase I, putative [Pediculus humanus corporis]|uniref:Carnitine palmitoyltransferase I, putative n=1 Tax=Pediculus humanus subsp. corporis TaxID=121224 RepID=E0VY59_PEDHC|nr:carnitine palmitoyltransferase I, putative [Pediculus humanus corporis]EEB18315.1 carnitine palmitoyltransferase I, putative [Pediculus humanus corporis]